MGEPLNPKGGCDAEPQVRLIIAHMFQCVNRARNGDVEKDLIIKDENHPDTFAQPQDLLPQQMQFLDAQRLNILNTSWVATSWNSLHSVPTRYQTTYAYKMMNQAAATGRSQDDQTRECFYTSSRQAINS